VGVGLAAVAVAAEGAGLADSEAVGLVVAAPGAIGRF
jgi:hypothetical protein